MASNASDMPNQPQPPSNGPRNDSQNSTSRSPAQLYPSMTVALFVYWILPLFCIALFSRKLHTEIHITIPVDPPSARPTPPSNNNNNNNKKPSPSTPHTTESRRPTTTTTTSLVDSLPSTWPTSYRESIQTIHQRRRHIPGFGVTDLVAASATKEASPSPQTNKSKKTKKKGQSSDPTKVRFQETISQLKQDWDAHPNDIYKALAVADAMRLYDLQFHEGGTYEQQALQLYDIIVDMATAKREAALQRGQLTNRALDLSVSTVSDEVRLEYPQKSLDGLVCGIFTAKGKVYFMANMFERAVEAYNGCLDICNDYLDARNARGSSLIVLGQYKQAAEDFLTVIEQDHQRLFIDSFSGMARVLEAKEAVVEGGWETVTNTIKELIPSYEQILQTQPQSKRAVAEALNRLHHTLFMYHEAKTKDYATAIDHLNQAHKHKLSILPKWQSGTENVKIQQTMNIFRKGFWTGSTGSQTKTPIFIIGFVRSGSTLLERILDAHPAIAGTGENSVFNGRLDDIRNQIVKASNSGGNISSLTRSLADEVVEEMERRWELVERNSNTGDNEALTKPLRLADKMLTNYYNVGFIEMLYPNALILHVAREPMDSVFSAYKHEFPPGTLDYTSDYEGLSDLYHAYRDIMDHWEQTLPGRITHIRYEDMVQDFEGVAKKIIQVTGLPWDDAVLQFHKKKHAVNTLSSTQVRKGVYQSSMKSWMRYEDQLAPLLEKIGDRTKWDLKTTLPGYAPPTANSDGGKDEL